MSGELTSPDFYLSKKAAISDEKLCAYLNDISFVQSEKKFQRCHYFTTEDAAWLTSGNFGVNSRESAMNSEAVENRVREMLIVIEKHLNEALHDEVEEISIQFRFDGKAIIYDANYVSLSKVTKILGTH